MLFGGERNEEGGWGWTEGEGLIDQLIGVSGELMRGDYRALFLGWLADFDPDAKEEKDKTEVDEVKANQKEVVHRIGQFLIAGEGIDENKPAVLMQCALPKSASQD